MSKTILVVDDEPMILKLIASLLTERGYAVEAVSNGAGALQQIRRIKPDVVLLDIMMPSLDGIAVAEALRRQPATAHIPVVFLTSLIADDEMSRIEHRIGGQLMLSKPFKMPDLITVIETALATPSHPKEVQDVTDIFPRAA